MKQDFLVLLQPPRKLLQNLLCNYLEPRFTCFLTPGQMQLLFGALLLFYVPHLDSYPGYMPLSSESIDGSKDKEPLGDHVCPERDANVFSSK